MRPRCHSSLLRPSTIFTAYFGALALLLAMPTAAEAYDKATEGNEVVMNKLFPKKSKIELDGEFGVVLNSSFVQTFLAHAGLTYFWSEEWGFNLEGNFAINSDKHERNCVETFYNDPNRNITTGVCQSEDTGAGISEDQPNQDANYGPAYPPIRELKYMFLGNFIWNPIYGKQIVLLSATNYFDFFIGMGGGIAMSNFYPKQTQFAGTNHNQRGDYQCTADQKKTNPNCDASQDPGTKDTNLIGKSGRPVPQSESNPVLHASIGQRFHFLKRFEITASLEDYLLVGTESGFDNFLTIMGGAGVRF